MVATLVTALSALGGEVSDSGWATTGGTIRVTSRLTQPRVADKWSPATHAKPRAAGQLRLVAFEEEAPQGAARLESVVVQRGDSQQGYRIAQQDDLLESFSEPFAEESTTPDDEFAPDTSGFEDPGLDPLPPMDDDFGADDQTPVAPSPSDDGGRLQDVNPEDIGRPRPRRPRADPSQAENRQQALKACGEELAELKASRISQISLSIRPTGEAGEDYPFECSIDDGTPFMDRSWPQVCYMWKASALCHKPLYFENVQLERYGHSWGPCLQPIMSGVHFFGTLPVLPYCMGLKAPNECVYTLGHYRPGNCAPYLIPAVPITKRAVLSEAAAWTGGIFAIP